MKTSEKVPAGHKGNPIPIEDRSQARANLSYIIQKPAAKPVKKGDADGEAVSS